MTNVKTPRRLTREESRAQTRERLLDAAAALFIERGFHGASVEEISERAGYTRGAFYSNFDSKDDIFLELFKRRLSVRIDEITTIFQSSSSFAEALARVREGNEQKRRTKGDDYESRTVLTTEFWLYAMRNPELRQRLAEIDRVERRAYERAIKAQFKAACLPLPASATDLAIVVQCLDHNLLKMHAIDPKGVRREFFFEAVGLLFEAGVALSRQQSGSGGDPAP